MRLRPGRDLALRISKGGFDPLRESSFLRIAAGISVLGFGPHPLRAKTATNMLDHEADSLRDTNAAFCTSREKMASWSAYFVMILPVAKS